MFAFERLGRDDFGLLARWLAEPHVSRWWNHDPSPDAIEDDFGDVIDGEEPAEDYVVRLHGRPIGLIQYARFHDYDEYVAELAEVYPVGTAAASIDYFVGDPGDIGLGIGTAMIGAFVERIWTTHPDIDHLVVPVNAANVASWRALQKAGFELVARGELVPDNPIDNRLHLILRLDRPARPQPDQSEAHGSNA